MRDQTPPSDAELYVASGSLEAQTKSQSPPRAHTSEECPHVEKMDDVTTIPEDEETPTVEMPAPTNSVLTTRTERLRWCEWCKKRHGGDS